ncbi:MAG: hypothetical protein FWE07_02615 [Turicibacter sp.]|nr:hypothetical protein [Turicibacter sp.]
MVKKKVEKMVDEMRAITGEVWGVAPIEGEFGERIRKLKEQLQPATLAELKGKKIVIAIPSRDKNNNKLEATNYFLFFKQSASGHELAIYLEETIGIDLVKLLSNVDAVNKINAEVDYLIFLHSFEDLEKEKITEVLHSESLKIIELT